MFAPSCFFDLSFTTNRRNEAWFCQVQNIFQRSRLRRFSNWPGSYRIFDLFAPDRRRRPRRFGTDGHYPKFIRRFFAKTTIDSHYPALSDAVEDKLVLQLSYPVERVTALALFAGVDNEIQIVG